MYDVLSKNRIMKEMSHMKINSPQYIRNLGADEKNLRKWTLTLEPDFLPYKNCQIRVEVEFPEEYPFKPPHLVVLSPIYHPNVTQGGEICLSIIQADNWKPAMTCINIFDSLLYLLRFPEPELVGSELIAVQYMQDRALYMKTAAEKSKEM